MIVVDTSALMAIVLGEAHARSCADALAGEANVAISAGTLAEALIVAGRRNIAADMQALIEGLGMDIASVTPAFARKVADAYSRWGKDVDPAGLNFGDCFAYALAREQDCPLLFVGDDFAKTDVRRVA